MNNITKYIVKNNSIRKLVGNIGKKLKNSKKIQKNDVQYKKFGNFPLNSASTSSSASLHLYKQGKKINNNKIFNKFMIGSSINLGFVANSVEEGYSPGKYLSIEDGIAQKNHMRDLYDTIVDGDNMNEEIIDWELWKTAIRHNLVNWDYVKKTNQAVWQRYIYQKYWEPFTMDPLEQDIANAFDYAHDCTCGANPPSKGGKNNGFCHLIKRKALANWVLTQDFAEDAVKYSTEGHLWSPDGYTYDPNLYEVLSECFRDVKGEISVKQDRTLAGSDKMEIYEALDEPRVLKMIMEAERIQKVSHRFKERTMTNQFHKNAFMNAWDHLDEEFGEDSPIEQIKKENPERAAMHEGPVIINF